MTPSQYRRAPIPAYGRTIEAMRLELLDTPAGRSMINAGDTRLYWMNESDAYMLMSPFGIESPFINTNAPDAVARLVEAARAENERLRTIIDNLHAVEEKHRETANAQLHRANRLQVEKGRLRGLLAEAIQWNWNDFEEAPTESSEACLPLLVDLHQRIKSALAQKGGE
jgi:hypothetical protein